MLYCVLIIVIMYMYTLFKPQLLFSVFIKTETNFFSYNLVSPLAGSRIPVVKTTNSKHCY